MKKEIFFEKLREYYHIIDNNQKKCFLNSIKRLRDKKLKYYDGSKILNELSATGAVAGYQTPFSFTKNKEGSKRALDVTKKLGFKVAKSISEKNEII